MSISMNKEKLQALTNELTKEVKTPDDLSQLSAMLTKMTVEAALRLEMNFHLGYDKHQSIEHHNGNSRNGYSTKNNWVKVKLILRIFYTRLF